ncbi:endonuclease 8-like 3 [Paramuricea clavata]|uniref:Endonuclease 8-like 3, partial n=1 Tax=Paramuricea clavata TaxID=317549 RepID=A0A7D9DJ36_PARCT|nr:endonuclease 8-like 3 [Paramuricea clavata]
MNKFGQDHYVTGSGRTLTIYKDGIVRQFSLLANRTVRWSAYMENLLLIPQQAMDHFEDEGYMYEKAITAWRCTEQPHPRCDGHHKLAKMCVVKNLMNVNYGRPFFVCGEKAKPCSFWMWGDVQPLAKPECRHGLPCAVRKVKKEGLHKDRLFFCCSNDKESTCRFFEWAPQEEVIPFEFVYA